MIKDGNRLFPAQFELAGKYATGQGVLQDSTETAKRLASHSPGIDHDNDIGPPLQVVVLDSGVGKE